MNLTSNCSICPYSKIDIYEPVKFDGKPSTIAYCKLGYPVECREGRLPKELKERYEGKLQ